MSEVTLQEIKSDLTKAFEDMKEMQKDNVTKEEMKRIDDSMDAKEDRINKLEAELKKATMPSRNEMKQGEDSLESKRVLNKFLRKGYTKLTKDEQKMFDRKGKSLLTEENQNLEMQSKAMYSNDDEDGGYLTGGEFIKQIIKNITEYSPIRELASVRSTSLPYVEIPKRTSTFSAVWTSQQADRVETTGLKFGKERIPAEELMAKVLIGYSNLEDSYFNLEQELATEFAEQFGVAEGTAFTTGDGVGNPFGIMSASGLNEVVSGDATLLTADSLINAYYALKTPYIANSTWLMERATVREIRKFKDGNGQYLWTPGLAGVPSTILESPYRTGEDMASIGAGTYPVVFGDFKKAYQIIDRIIMDIMRDPYSNADTGCVTFNARKRVGGQVIKPEALVKIEISAS